MPADIAISTKHINSGMILILGLIPCSSRLINVSLLPRRDSVLNIQTIKPKIENTNSISPVNCM